MTTTQSIKHAPDFVPHREGVSAPDGLPATLTDKTVGINTHGYLSMLVQVIPTGGSNPTVQVLSFSEGAGHFIQQNPDQTFAGVGADLPYEFAIECRSRVMFIRVSVQAAGSTEIRVSGHELDHAR